MKLTPLQPGQGVRDTSTPEAVRSSKAIAAFNKGQSSYDTSSPQAQPPQSPQIQVREELAPPAPVQERIELSQEAQEPQENQDLQGQVDTIVEPKREDTKLQNQWQILARKERAQRAKQQQANEAIKVRELALATKEAEFHKRSSEFSPSEYFPKSSLKSEAMKAIARGEIPYDEVVNQVMNQAPIDPRLEALIQQQESQIKRLNEKLEGYDKSTQEAQTQQYQAALTQIRNEVTALVKSDPNYETVRATNSIRDVVELIEKTYNEDGILMSVEQATEEVENYLIEEAMKLTKIEKIKKRLQPSPAASGRIDKQTPRPEVQTHIKTLTNTNSKSSRQLSAKERAVLAFKGELK